MALNIPVNLMNKLAYVTQVQSTLTAADTTIVQPTPAGAGAYNSAANGGGNSAGRDNTAQTQRLSARAPAPNGDVMPDRAEPKSVVTAQGTPSMPLVLSHRSSATPAPSDTPERRLSELDRYAPPDPLPTAPILRAASAYAARMADL
jgi:hypothetical protein